MHGLRRDIRTLHHDTALMAYLLDPGSGKFLLDDLALRFLSVEVQSPDAEPGTLDLDGELEIEQTGRRAAVVLQLAAALDHALDARELTDLYERFELPLVRVLARMETFGIRIDREFLEVLSKDLGEQCEMYVQRIYAHAGKEFNVNSTPQLRTILFDELGLIPVKKTKTGPSTDADSLAEDGRGPPDRRRPPALPRGREAAQHLRRRAAAAHRGRRSHPRHLQADRHHHRSHLERGAQPAERAGAHRRRSRDAPGVRRRRRAGGSSPPTTRRSSCGSSRTSPRIPD